MARRERRGGQRPPGYPSEYECALRLDDGRRVQVAPILPSDAPELANAIRTADSVTLHNRFLGAPPPLTDAVLRKLTVVDYATHFALVARNRGKGVAIARYMALPASQDGKSEAEIAVAVAPNWRRAGLASALVEMLARRGHECGITEFTALFLPTNRPVIELARGGHARVVIREGAANLYAPLAQLDADATETGQVTGDDCAPDEDLQIAGRYLEGHSSTHHGHVTV